MNDDPLLVGLADANAYGNDSPLPPDIWSAEDALAEIELRIGLSRRGHAGTAVLPPPRRVQEHEVIAATERPVPTRRLRRGVLVAAAAFVTVLIVGTIFETFEFSDRGSPVGSQDALAVVDGYFAAFEAGDLDALTALLDPSDPTRFVQVCEGRCTYYDSWSFDYHQRNVAYKMAQGTALLSRDCTVTDTTNVDLVVTCEYLEYEYVASLVGAPPAPTVATITVTGTGIGAIELAYGDEAPAHAAETQFKTWMSRLHPEDWGSVGQRAWSSVDDATAKGELTAEYGDEWAAYLEANECSYLDGC